MTPTTLLIVEDEAVIAMELEDRLTRLGYSIADTVASGEAALRSAAAAPPDLVLMDIYIQGASDGIATAHELRARFDLPIIYLTAYADDDTLRRAQVTEPFGYLLKPFRERELHATIEMALYRHRAERELRQSRARIEEQQQFVERITQTMPDVVYVLDLVEQREVFINRQIGALLGYSPAAQSAPGGASWSTLIHPDDQPRLEASIQAMSANQSSEVTEVQYRMRRADNGWSWLSSRNTVFSRAEDGSVRQILCIVQDISERVQAQEAVQNQAARAEALARVATQLNAQLSTTTVLQTVCETIADTIKDTGVAIALSNPADQTLSVVADVGLPPAYRTEHTATPLADFAGVSHEHSEEPQVITDVQEIDSLPKHQLYRDLDIRTIVGIGLARRGRILGGLQLMSRGRVRRYTRDELALLKGLAAQATQAIANAQLYEESQRRLNHLQGLRMIDLSIAASLDLKLTLAIVLDQVLSQLLVDAATVLLYQPQTHTLEHAAGRGFRTDALQYTRLPVGDGLAGAVALERQIIAIPDRLQETSHFARSALLGDEQFVAYYGVPLIAKGQLQGVLELFHRAPLHPDSEWRRFLEMLASQAAIAIESLSLFEHLQRSNTELALAYDSTLEGWSRALDLRDRETEGHTQRVTGMTLRLARALGMNEEELVQIRRGALLHDIGKMGIPDRILLKPGRLTSDEWEIMRMHPVYAHQLLYPIRFLRPALDIPYSHHERWDGSGYPRSLRREEIPLAARLFAVVDVWDALRSDRPYRAGWPEERVLDYIARARGMHFDPEVVDIFLRHVTER